MFQLVYKLIGETQTKGEVKDALQELVKELHAVSGSALVDSAPSNKLQKLYEIFQRVQL